MWILFHSKSFEVCSNITLREILWVKSRGRWKGSHGLWSVSLHYHNEQPGPLHAEFNELLQNYVITACFNQHRERVLFEQSWHNIWLSTPSNNANKCNIKLPSKKYVSAKAFSLQRTIFCTTLFAGASNVAESTEFCTLLSSARFSYAKRNTPSRATDAFSSIICRQ
jgi:hypothetical protein